MLLSAFSERPTGIRPAVQPFRRLDERSEHSLSGVISIAREGAIDYERSRFSKLTVHVLVLILEDSTQPAQVATGYDCSRLS